MDNRLTENEVKVPDNWQGIMTLEEIEESIKRYEEKHGMLSDEFLQKLAAGNMPDTYDVADWQLLLECRKQALVRGGLSSKVLPRTTFLAILGRSSSQNPAPNSGLKLTWRKDDHAA